MKRVVSLMLVCSLLLSVTACSVNGSSEAESMSPTTATNYATTEVSEISETEVATEQITLPLETSSPFAPEETIPEFTGLDDAALLTYMEDTVYSELVAELNSDEYFVENISAVYVSKEYLEELSYNSQENIFFGYTLSEVDACFQGTRYVFTLGENGQTIVQPFEEYDNTYEQVLKNVVIGSGVILLCVTVSAVTAGTGASAVSMIFAVSAKTGATMGLSSGILGAIGAGIVTGVQTGDFDEAMKAAALSGSEAFKFGVISGAISGGTAKAVALKGATMNGLTMNQAAQIQKESGYPLSIIKQFHSMDEYVVFQQAGLQAELLGGNIALVRSDIDLYNVVDEYGRNNFARMSKGLNPIDSNGNAFQWHHIGQKNDATLALLTETEHDVGALHGFNVVSEIDRARFSAYKKTLNKALLSFLLRIA